MLLNPLTNLWQQLHKPYLTRLKTNSNDFYDIRCTKKGATKSFQFSKVIDQCGESYKTLFTKVFHILVYLPYSNYNMFFVQTHSELFIPYF
jgi:hypothetical protein